MKKNNKEFRNTVSVFLVLIILISICSIGAFATDVESLEKGTTVINEWDEYNRIVSMSDKKLSEAGYNKDEIAEIRAFDYEAEIKNRAKLDNQTLKAYGYTDKEIEELRQAAAMDEIPESVMKSISTSTMTSKLSYVSNGSRFEGNGTMYYVNMKFSWSWSRIPIFRLYDMVAVGYNSLAADQFSYCKQTNNNVHADLKPLLSNLPTHSQVVPWTYSTNKPNAISAKFQIGMQDMNGVLTHFAYDGYGTFQLTNRSNYARVFIDACYGHMTVSVNPGFGVNLSGGEAKINFNLGFDEQHCTGHFFEDFSITDNYIQHGTVIGKK